MSFRSHDYIASLFSKKTGTKMKTFREWNEHGHQRIVNDMMQYAKYVNDLKNKDENGDSEKEKPLNYKNGPGTLPLLPEPTMGVRGKEVAKSAREIIRSYFQRHYSKFPPSHSRLVTDRFVSGSTGYRRQRCKNTLGENRRESRTVLQCRLLSGGIQIRGSESNGEGGKEAD